MLLLTLLLPLFLVIFTYAADTKSDNPKKETPKAPTSTENTWKEIKMSKVIFTLQNHDGSKDTTESLEYPQKLASVLACVPGDHLRVSFTLNTATGTGGEDRPFRAHQAFLHLKHAETSKTFTKILKSVTNGKHRLDLKLKESEATFQQHPGIYEVSLAIGGFGDFYPIHYNLGSINIDYPLAAAATVDDSYEGNVAEFFMQPEIKHTFRQPEKTAPVWLSRLFTAICLSPWLLLLVLWDRIGVNFKGISTPIQQSSGVVFILTLIGFVMLNYFYWTELKLGMALVYFGGLSVNAIFTGQRTLNDLAQTRLHGPAPPEKQQQQQQQQE